MPIAEEDISPHLFQGDFRYGPRTYLRKKADKGIMAFPPLSQSNDGTMPN